MSSNEGRAIIGIIEFNPSRALKKGIEAPFIEMADLPVNSRDITSIGKRVFSGSGSKFKNGDTLFARITPCLENGKTAKVSGLENNQVAHGSTEFIVFSPKNPNIDEDFVYYIARLPEFRLFAISQLEGTSGRQRVAWQSLSKFDFEFPEETERKAIGNFLRKMDDKIELNRQINQTLEKIAQAIFKSWLVDFDPVKAKIWANENGHDPERAAMCALAGLPYADDALDHLSPEQQQQLATTAALFPDTLEESELGEIPSGWAIRSLKDCCTRVESGGTPKRSEDSYWNGDIPWLTSGEVRDVIVLDTKEKISQTGLENSSAKIWPEFTTVVAMYGATAGQTCLLANPMTANQACCALIPKEGYSTFIFITARNATEDFLGKASGSAQQNLNKSLVADHPVLLPNADVMRAFEARTAGNIRLWIQLAKECVTLSTLRDTLLPKLLSGELSVANLPEVADAGASA